MRSRVGFGGEVRRGQRQELVPERKGAETLETTSTRRPLCSGHGLGLRVCAEIPVLAFASPVTSGKALNLSVPQISHLKNGDENRTQ